MSGWLCEMGSGLVTVCFGTPSLQLPNSPSAQACRGVGELGTWPILSIQLPKCAGAPGSWGVGELAWVSASCMVEGEFCCWQLLERHTAGRGHGSTLWKMDGCRIKGAAVLGCKSSQWHLKLFWLFNEAIKCWQVPDQVANRVNVWNNCDLVAMLPICSFCAGIPEKAAQTHP